MARKQAVAVETVPSTSDAGGAVAVVMDPLAAMAVTVGPASPQVDGAFLENVVVGGDEPAPHAGATVALVALTAGTSAIVGAGAGALGAAVYGVPAGKPALIGAAIGAGLSLASWLLFSL